LVAHLNGIEGVSGSNPLSSIINESAFPSNYQRGYVDKPREYAARSMSEYWWIDPSRDVVALLVLDGTAYKVRKFKGGDLVPSSQFKPLGLTAEQILTKS
jgi:Uma2 family endonuclease